MATPIVNLVRPPRGWSAGGTIVQIDGGDFRMPAPAPRRANAPVPAPAPTVEVLFDGIPSPRVDVVSSTILRCVAPRHPPDRVVNGEQISFGTVNVVVRNLDDNGVPIPGESTPRTNAFTYVRPQLGTAEVRGAWLRVVDEFLEHWRNILMENVAFNPSVDYDAETGDVSGYVELAELPGIAVTGVTFPDSDSDPENGDESLQADENTILIRRSPVKSDFAFKLVIVSDHQGELLNIAEAVKTCFRDAAIFQVQVDPDDPSHGMADFTMVLTADISVSERMGNTNLVTAEASGMVMAIRSVDMPGAPTEGLPGVPTWIPHQGTRGITRPANRIVVGTSRRL